MNDLPAFIGTGQIHFRLGVTVTDSRDPDVKPDFIPARGTVTFRAAVDYIPYPSTPEGPLTILKGPIIAKFDEEGYLSTYDTGTGEFLYRGVVLGASDDPNTSVKDWTWTASYNIDPIQGTKFNFPTHNFYVHTDSVQDLSTLIPVPGAKGNALAQAELAALRAEAAAVVAEQNSLVAMAVEQRADSGDFDGDTITMGTTTTLIPGTPSTAVLVETGPNQKRLDLGITKGDPGGWVIAAPLGSTVHLDDVKVPGLYVTLAAQPGSPFNVPCHLEVQARSGQSAFQKITPISTSIRSNVFAQRASPNSVWDSWSTFTSTRTDNTAGRVIYQWDETENREQIIYGNTGWRNVNSLVPTHKSGNALVRRTLNNIEFMFVEFAVTDQAVDLYVPMHFLGGAILTGGIPLLNMWGVTTGLLAYRYDGLHEVRFLSDTSSITGYASFPARVGWPTTLPGVASGTIPYK